MKRLRLVKLWLTKANITELKLTGLPLFNEPGSTFKASEAVGETCQIYRVVGRRSPFHIAKRSARSRAE